MGARPAEACAPHGLGVRHSRRRRDLDNLIKALLDLLVAHQVITDDAMVASVTSRWDTSVASGRILIGVQSATVPVAECASSRGLDL